jgi:hypothetical protein
VRYGNRRRASHREFATPRRQHRIGELESRIRRKRAGRHEDGGYESAGKFVASGGNAPASGAFSDRRLTEWLARNRNIKFDKSQGPVSSIWVGPMNTSAVFLVTGDTGNVEVTGMRRSSPRTRRRMKVSYSRTFASRSIIGQAKVSYCP